MLLPVKIQTAPHLLEPIRANLLNGSKYYSVAEGVIDGRRLRLQESNVDDMLDILRDTAFTYVGTNRGSMIIPPYAGFRVDPRTNVATLTTLIDDFELLPEQKLNSWSENSLLGYLILIFMQEEGLKAVKLPNLLTQTDLTGSSIKLIDGDAGSITVVSERAS